jgi:hypothetical protein
MAESRVGFILARLPCTTNSMHPDQLNYEDMTTWKELKYYCRRQQQNTNLNWSEPS